MMVWKRWTPLNYGHVLDIYVRFQGCRFVLIKKLYWEVSQSKMFRIFFGGRHHVFKWPICSKRFCWLSLHTTIFRSNLDGARWWDGWENPSHGINTRGGRAIVWLNLFAQEIQGGFGGSFGGEILWGTGISVSQNQGESTTKKNLML